MEASTVRRITGPDIRFIWYPVNHYWFQVAALPKGAKVEMEAIAIVGEINDYEMYWSSKIINKKLN